ncbi:hypothetical protein HN51_020755 [Arachis hypogaea]|uniref:PX domain-containing protein n=1 Tax=Arachis hypogaea TaxID=3818 RepID=A0A445C261_ARAHY|nr:uncharacterized protein LOC112708186 [Arachis hypogaea]QHO32779.1 uncharacterized protein DS421_8g252660 [Arachis hypogaea]RYR45012.1 hypothetical protein Ahy_A08g041266 [Arachis hypogaea]
MGERTPESSDLFQPLLLRITQSDGDDAAAAASVSPLSRYSSCGGESEFDRYCSAASLMGTPSVCGSAVTLFNDFSDADFANGLDNFTLGGGGRSETNHDGDCGRSLRYGSSGLELYGDCSDELAMTVLDSSELLGFSNDRIGNCDNNGNARVEDSEKCGVGVGDARSESGMDQLDDVERAQDDGLSDLEGEDSMRMVSNSDVKLEGGLCGEGEGLDQFYNFGVQLRLEDKEERENERVEEGGLSDFEHSEGEDSMYNYGSDSSDGNRNESFVAKSVQYREELEARNENPLLINSSVAFGSNDLDDFLLDNDRFDRSPEMSVFFHEKQKKNNEVRNDAVNFDSASSVGLERGKDEMNMVAVGEKVEEIKDEPEAVKEVIDITPAMWQVQGANKLNNEMDSSTHTLTDFPNTVNPQVQGVDALVNCPKTSSITMSYDVYLDPITEGGLQHKGLNATDSGNLEKGNKHTKSEISQITTEANLAQHVKNTDLGSSMVRFDHFPDSRVDQSSSNPSNHIGNMNGNTFDSHERILHHSNVGMRQTLESISTLTEHLEKTPAKSKTEDFELNEFYDEVVQEMEEILLDSMDSPGARHSMHNRMIESQLSMPSRDGGLTASTSSMDNAYMLGQRPARIDRIEVVGARQKKGDVSFSERLVGVKEYTVYKIKVWSGRDQWEVERRYRDFLSLYRSLKTLFSEQGWNLPSPWSSIEKESKMFRSASPDIIAKRSVLIQECLQSILRTRFYSSLPRALTLFLSPQDSDPLSHVSNALVSRSSFTGGIIGNSSTLGKTISLIVEIPPNKSVRQLLEAQHYTCAGCHKHLDNEKTLIQDLVQTFGWGKPRLCEYTGQLFCTSCHTNETAVLPARVLHHWDFSHHPVSQLAKSYLDSIHEQPMLCVTAVNPFLLLKVPALRRVMNVRKKIGIMLPFVRCPFRRSINRALGSRRYLLESNDFFSLRDLIDLSKGVFAALPVMVETVSSKIMEHITDQCLICCDVGVPCSGRQDCSDPSSLIFPFQEDDIERCKACQSVFHKRCFRKHVNCPCGIQLGSNETKSLTKIPSQKGISDSSGTLDLLGRGLSSAGLSPKLLSGLFSREKPEKTREHKDENIILMGSLPSNSL